MRIFRWLVGLLLVLVFLGINFLFISIPPIYKLINVLIFCTFLIMLRVAFGPTTADRIVAVDILGILIVGFCALMSIGMESTFYLDIAIAWALQSFIASLALAKILEGRHLND